MPVFVDFSLTDKTIYNKQLAWREANLSEAEVSKRTGEWIVESAKAPKTSVLELFPDWLKKFLRAEMESIDASKLRFDSDNACFKTAVPMDLMEFDEYLNDVFSKHYVELINGDAEKTKFATTYQLHPSVTEADEHDAMADLENHSRGAAKKAYHKQNEPEAVSKLSDREEALPDDLDEEVETE